jgi:DNA-binding response OmpR family regulator
MQRSGTRHAGTPALQDMAAPNLLSTRQPEAAEFTRSSLPVTFVKAYCMREKILVIEDNSEFRELLRLIIKEAGFCVVTAKNGIEALKKARSVQPDLIVLDLVLPELDGFAVCEILRKDPASAGIPVIVLTGLTSEITRYAGLESGANEYVTKPASPEHLVSRIKHWLKERKRPARPDNSSETPRPAFKPRAIRTPAGIY